MNIRKGKIKKHKIIRRGHGKEPTIIEFNLSKAVILLMLIVLVLIAVATKKIVTTILDVNEKELLLNEQEISNSQSLAEINGELGYITSAQISNMKTGVGPFDENDEPGNDSSEDNNIVRSFDQITWTVELTFGLKNGTTETNLKGGVIEVQAELPENLANLVEWNLDSMNWIEDAILSNDGRSLTGKYKMDENKITIPGKQSIIFILKVKNAIQGTIIEPTFTIKLLGNEDKEKVTTTSEKVIVSSTGKYNIQLKNNTANLSNKTTVSIDNKEIEGRMYGYGFTVQLYNESEPKGLKGLEYPKGEISFDIDLKLERSKFQSDELEDITSEATPILWNYRVNNWDTNDITGNIKERDMYYNDNMYTIYHYALPLGIDTGDRTYSTYNSGDIKIVQKGSKLLVTINNYDFDGEFPMNQCYNRTNSANRTKIYTENIGTFSVGYMQIFVPDNEASTMESRNYYLTISDSNMNIISNTDKVVTNQMNKGDDTLKKQHVIYKPGSYTHEIQVSNQKGTFGSVESSYGAGDGKANVGDILSIDTRFRLAIAGDYDIYTANRFVKFDGNAFEPVYGDDGSKYETVLMDGKAEFKVWYVTKKDGTNWKNQEEMNNENIEDMDIYENIEDIPKDKICIGIYFETISGYISRTSGANNNLRFKLKIKETAEIGKTYGITQRTWYWKDKLDRKIYTITNPDVNWPEEEWDSGNINYIKTEYDENGQIITGTHSGGCQYGNTVLVVGANLYGNIRAIDNLNNDKIDYNLDKNENIITYSLEPQLDANENLTSQIENVTLKAEVIIPKGLIYVKESTKVGEENYTEPNIIENEDGTTTLVWYISGVTSGQKIEPITFEAKISNNSKNGTQYEATFIISEKIDDDGNTKIGNSEIKNRTSTKTINVINLASFRLYKEVEKSLIEKNGEIHYVITGKNNTDTSLPEFTLLDILPYNGDNRGTKFDGKYTIDKIIISQNIDGKKVENDNLKLYISQNELVKNLTVKDIQIEEKEIWQEISEVSKEYIINTEQTNDRVTGIAVKGELAGQTEIIIDIYLKTTGNKAENKYVNMSSAQTQIKTDAVQTSQATVQVIGRTIKGNVWLDKNYNSIMDNGENFENINTKEIVLKLNKIDKTGNLEEAIDVDGKIVEAINPNETGYYEFSNLPKGDYLVEVQYDGEIYKLVEKEIGENQEINSKFEQKEQGIGQTEILTKLNSNSDFKIEEINVNVGLCKKINFEFIKIAEENHENRIGGTEFKLYKLNCTIHEPQYHNNELLDTSNNSLDCWELIETQESSSDKENKGKIEFEDIELNQEYRLIETKSSLNRIKPEGQWKIQFKYKDESDNALEENLIGENILIQITAIGNPPAFIKENGNMLLPNRAIFELPTSGSFGNETIYKIGITTILLGIVLFFITKVIFMRKNLHK